MLGLKEKITPYSFVCSHAAPLCFHSLGFNLVNAGKSSYNAMICIQNKCLDTNGTGATVDGYGHSNFTLIFDLNQSDNLEVNFKLTFENEIVEFNQTLNYDFEIKSEKSNLLLIFSDNCFLFVNALSKIGLPTITIFSRFIPPVTSNLT